MKNRAFIHNIGEVRKYSKPYVKLFLRKTIPKWNYYIYYGDVYSA